MRAVQAATPPRPAKLPQPVVLEGCSPALLLPPLSKGDPLMELAGGVFELGDRVAFTGSGDGPEFGSTGCVVGVIDDAVEVMFDVSPARRLHPNPPLDMSYEMSACVEHATLGQNPRHE